MRALDAIHAALRPGGVLLNIHPEPRHARIAVRLGERVEQLGAIDQSIQIHNIHVARAALRHTIAAQQWRLERAISFTFLYYFESVDAWLQYLADRGSQSVIAESLIARARALLAAGTAHGNGELIQRRTLRAERLRRA